MGWLEDFVEHTKYGEAPERVMYWVGVSTIAGALRRKVWIDEFLFQWTPNFYILLVGPAGVLKKSTSSGVGMRILNKVEGIDFGPQSMTWEQLISHMAASTQEYKIGDKPFEASCCTIELSEFGTLFDPANRQMVDNMTDLWDSKLHTFRKETKTNGCDTVVNPWINLIAGVTPGWLDDNFSDKFIRSGFASRVVYVHCRADEVKENAHPSQDMPPDMQEAEDRLFRRLVEISTYAGEYKLTPQAYAWSKEWYHEYRKNLAQMKEDDMSLFSRKQTHLMKLAMIISASRGKFPVIDVAELEESNRKLVELTNGIDAVFGRVGQSPVSKMAREVVEALAKHGEMTRKELYRKYFFRVSGVDAFDEAVKSAKAGGLIREGGRVDEPMLKVVV